ncbi:hypothetical protein AgCh_001498 [Apium graveolens]
MTSQSDFIWGWVFCDGNIVMDDAEGVKYDRKMTRLVKLELNLKFEGLLNLLHTKLWTYSTLYKLNVSRRFLNPSTNMFEIAPMFDDDDIEYMFESVAFSSLRNYVELYVDKISVGSDKNLNVGGEMSISGERSSSSYSSKKLRTSESDRVSGGVSGGVSGSVSSGSSSRCISHLNSDTNSRGSSELQDEDISFYKSFDGSSMVASFHEPVMNKSVDILNASELQKGRMFETKKELMRIVKDAHIANHQEIKVMRSDPVGWEVECKRKMNDGTHLYDKYGGVLLTATAVDGFNHILSVASAIVEGENATSWSWFMERLKNKVVIRRRDVCVISDRHKGIISVMNNPELGWCEPHSHHRFCSRHLAANFGKEFRKDKIKERIVPLCSQITGPKFTLHWNALIAAEPRAQQWFDDKPLSRWSLAFDEGKRFRIMTTNMAESWNNAIKVARKLPITALVKTIFHKLVAYFDQHRIEVEKQCVDGNLFTLHANKMLNRWKKSASGHHVTVFDRDSWIFSVTTMKRGQKGGKEHIVRLMERICTCNKWQTFHIPCSHVLACCANQNLDYTTLVSKWYRLDNARNVYGSAFEPLPGEDSWPLFDRFPKVVPDIEDIPKKPGRKKSTRYKNNMDYRVSARSKGTSSSGASSSNP